MTRCKGNIPGRSYTVSRLRWNGVARVALAQSHAHSTSARTSRGRSVFCEKDSGDAQLAPRRRTSLARVRPRSVDQDLHGGCRCCLTSRGAVGIDTPGHSAEQTKAKFPSSFPPESRVKPTAAHSQARAFPTLAAHASRRPNARARSIAATSRRNTTSSGADFKHNRKRYHHRVETASVVSTMAKAGRHNPDNAHLPSVR